MIYQISATLSRLKIMHSHPTNTSNYIRCTNNKKMQVNTWVCASCNTLELRSRTRSKQVGPKFWFVDNFYLIASTISFSLSQFNIVVDVYSTMNRKPQQTVSKPGTYRANTSLYCTFKYNPLCARCTANGTANLWYRI